MSQDTIAKAKVEIERFMENLGPYTHNIISIVLRQVAKDEGQEATNRLIEDYALDDIFGIRKQEGAKQ